MKTLVGAVAGALTVCAVVVSYGLGERQVFSRDPFAMGYQQPGTPYLVPAGQTGLVPYASPYVAQTPYGVMAPAGAYAVPVAQTVSDRYDSRPVVTRAASQRAYVSERAAKPQRSWQKSALLIGGSAAGGAGVGALIGGKKGAGIGALLGGGSAAIFDQVKRH